MVDGSALDEAGDSGPSKPGTCSLGRGQNLCCDPEAAGVSSSNSSKTGCERRVSYEPYLKPNVTPPGVG